MLSTAGGNAQRNKHIKHLEAENKELRAEAQFLMRRLWILSIKD